EGRGAKPLKGLACSQNPHHTFRPDGNVRRAGDIPLADQLDEVRMRDAERARDAECDEYSARLHDQWIDPPAG
ncbi:MAG: hypothetical protein ACRDGR_01140, partial [bacterium]